MTSTLFMIDGVQQYNVMDGQPIILYDSTNAKTSTIVQTGNDMIFTNATASGDITHDAKVALNLDIDGGQELVLTAAKLNPVTTSVFDIGDATHVYQKGFFEEIAFYDTTGAESGSITRSLTTFTIDSGTGGTNLSLDIAGVPRTILTAGDLTNQVAGANNVYIDSYTTTLNQDSGIILRHSINNSLGTRTETVNNTELGNIIFQGVDTGGNWELGAAIQVIQTGAAGVRIPADFKMWAYSSTGPHLEQFVLRNDGDVEVNHTGTKVLDVLATGVNIIGKLGVTGLIDPTGIKFAEQAADPGATGAGEGTVWVRNDAPNTLMFTDDTPTDVVIVANGAVVAADYLLLAGGSMTGPIIPAVTSATDFGDATHVWQNGHFEEVTFYDTTGAEFGSITRTLNDMIINPGTGGLLKLTDENGVTLVTVQANNPRVIVTGIAQFNSTIQMGGSSNQLSGIGFKRLVGDILYQTTAAGADITLDPDTALNVNINSIATYEYISTTFRAVTTSATDFGDGTHVWQTGFFETINFYDTTGAENASISRNLTEFLFNSGTGGEIIFQVAGTEVLHMTATFATNIGDGGTTNYVTFAADGELNLFGTARVKKEVGLIAVSLAPGQSGPAQSIVGDYIVQSFTINDDVVAQIEIPADWDPSTAIDVHLHWGVNEAEATVNGEVQWQIDWSATPTGEDYSNPTHSGVLDSGDISIATNAREQIHSDLGAIPSASLSVGDFIGLTLTRVALDGGNDPTAEPEVLKLELEYTCNKLGEAT